MCLRSLSIGIVLSGPVPNWSRRTTRNRNGALELYDPAFDVPIIFRAPFVHALAMSWTGRLEQAHHELTEVR
ncbi:hypothetical protein H7I76_21965, partial [Mycolicibacterium vaccae]|nr:hypothetical protein [Mycolicibacterium vaccae]